MCTGLSRSSHRHQAQSNPRPLPFQSHPFPTAAPAAAVSFSSAPAAWVMISPPPAAPPPAPLLLLDAPRSSPSVAPVAAAAPPAVPAALGPGASAVDGSTSAKTIAQVVGDIRTQLGLTDATPKDLFDIATKEYGVELPLAGTVKDKLRVVARELDVATGWPAP